MAGLGGRSRTRLVALVGALLLVPLGLATKIYEGPAAAAIRGSSGGALYVAFFCLAAFVIWPGARPLVVATSVLAATCLVEILQLWHPPWLEAIRATTPGGLLLGTTFVWADFPMYVVGGLLGWGALRLVRRLGRGREEAA